jgi:E3 ubiquitin-protein ligase mind-bomb
LTRLTGSRVVRGPDWRWGKQDGGAGHMGTVVGFESIDECVVVWDNGTEANYSCSIFHDLAVLEPPAHAVKDFVHQVKCDFCCVSPLRGIRWLCDDCLHQALHVNLCSNCYHNDCHNLKHKFRRILTQTSDRYIVFFSKVRFPKYEMLRIVSEVRNLFTTVFSVFHKLEKHTWLSKKKRVR